MLQIGEQSLLLHLSNNLKALDGIVLAILGAMHFVHFIISKIHHEINLISSYSSGPNMHISVAEVCLYKCVSACKYNHVAELYGQ